MRIAASDPIRCHGVNQSLSSHTRSPLGEPLLRARDGRESRSGLAVASLGAEDAIRFAQQPLNMAPDPRERLGSVFERERIDPVSEKP